MNNEILDGLNEQQLDAVCHKQGPQLVIAGAGTGKTAVITRRIAHLVNTKQCAAKNILALTFTDKAAEEMESRVDLLVPYGFTDSTICTFHAFGDKLLREYGFLLGLTPAYRVLSTAEQLIFLREHLFDLPIKRLRPLSDPTQHLRIILDLISRAKDEDVLPDVYLNYCQELEKRLDQQDNPAEKMNLEKQLEIATIYKTYQQLLLEHGLVDFGDLINLSLQVLREHPDVLLELQERYQYILVDEFQDTNAAQFELIRLLAGEQANITVVGDDDQSIYKFRGAAISNILQFQEYYPQSKINVLTQNYRSSQFILDAAYQLIQHNNPDRLEVKHKINKRLIANSTEGDPVQQKRFDTVSSEADWVAADIEKDKAANEKRSWSDYAVLVRSKKEAETFIRAMNVKHIPFRFAGNQGLYRQMEVKLCIAFLKMVADPTDPLAFHELATSEVYNMPAEDIAVLASLSKKTNQPMLTLLKKSIGQKEQSLTEMGMEIGTKFIEDNQHYLQLARQISVGQVLYRFLNESGFIARYTKEHSIEADLTIKNIARFFNVVQRYEQLAKSNRVIHFVQHLTMLEEVGDDPPLSEMDEDIAAVHVLTVHRAKGLEFPVVYLVGCAANRFPSISRNPALKFPDDLAKEELTGKEQSLAEERRLFYVAMTRAKEKLILTSSKDYGGKRSYKLSRFVMEALELQQFDEQLIQLSALEQMEKFAEVSQTKAVELFPLKLSDGLSLSYYQIDDYKTCPLKYKYVHLLRIPVLPHHSVFYGNAIHAAINDYYRLKQKQPIVDVEPILKTFLKTWVNQGFISQEHEMIRQQAGLDALKLFVEKENLNPIAPRYIEKSFAFKLGKNKVVGRIDRVDELTKRDWLIVDFKSSEVATQEDAHKRAKDSLQLNIYALAWLETEGLLPSYCQLYFVENGFIGSVKPDEDKLVKTREIIEEVAEGISKRDFRARPNVWDCHYCAYRSICPDAAMKT